VKKTLIILGSIFGGILLLCCGGGAVALFLIDGDTYAQPADACKTSSVGSLSGLGAVTGQQNKPVTDSGHTYGSCVITLGSGDAGSTLTVVINATSSASDVRAHYKTVKMVADKAIEAPNSGATVEDVDLGAKAFVFSTSAYGEFMIELNFYDDNLNVSLNLRSPTGSRTVAQAKPALVAIGKDLMSALKKGGGHDD